jgi:hypothetical protein
LLKYKRVVAVDILGQAAIKSLTFTIKGEQEPVLGTKAFVKGREPNVATLAPEL